MLLDQQRTFSRASDKIFKGDRIPKAPSHSYKVMGLFTFEEICCPNVGRTLVSQLVV